MRKAWRGVLEPLAASAATVCIGLLCLLFSLLNSNKSPGPVAAIGIVCAFLTTMTLLPALLVLPGVAFYLLLLIVGAVVSAVVGLPGLIPVWALAPARGVRVVGDRAPARARSGVGDLAALAAGALGVLAQGPALRLCGREARGHLGAGGRDDRAALAISWALTAVALLVAAFFVTTLKANGFSQADGFTRSRSRSLARRSWPGTSRPGPATLRCHRQRGGCEGVVTAAQQTPGVAAVVPFTDAAPGVAADPPPKVVDGLVQLEVTLKASSDSLAAEDTITALRKAVRAVPGADAKVGGSTAINLDTQEASRHDRTVIIPIVLLVILLILMLLLRSIVAPVLLVLTVVLSFVADARGLRPGLHAPVPLRRRRLVVPAVRVRVPGGARASTTTSS